MTEADESASAGLPAKALAKGGGLALPGATMTIGQRCALVCLVCLAPLQGAPEPYANLRDAELGYHGASEDFVGLTELRLGWFGPSDPEDPLTGDIWWAANLAIDEANIPPPAPRPSPHLPFRLLPRWSVDPWGTGVSQLTRMVYDEQPLALLGSIDSATTHLAEQVVAKANLPLVSPFATDPTITLAGVPWMFSCAPSDDAIARALVDAILASHVSTPAEDSSPDARRAAPDTSHASLLVLSTTDHESRMTTRAILREFSRRGRLPDLRREVAPGTVDLAPHLRITTADTPGTVLIVSGAEDAARLTRAVRAEFPAVAIFGGPSMGRRRYLEHAGPAADGVVAPRLFAPDSAATATADFVARFTAARGHAPDFTAALTYDATQLLTAAIRRAGPNRAGIREALIELSPWTGIAGTIEFDGTGQNRSLTVPMGVVRDGTLAPRR